MRPITQLRAGASILLGLMALGPAGMVLMHYAGMYAHVRSWEAPGATWNTPQGAFLQLTGPGPSLIVGALIAVGSGLSWAALGLVRGRSPAERAGLPAVAARSAGLGLWLGALNLGALIGLLAYRRYLLTW